MLHYPVWSCYTHECGSSLYWHLICTALFTQVKVFGNLSSGNPVILKLGSHWQVFFCNNLVFHENNLFLLTLNIHKILTILRKEAALNPQILSSSSLERLQRKPSSPTRSWRTLTFQSNQVELLHLQISLPYLVTFHSHHLIMFIGSENSPEPHLQNASWNVLIWECEIIV